MPWNPGTYGDYKVNQSGVIDSAERDKRKAAWDSLDNNALKSGSKDWLRRDITGKEFAGSAGDYGPTRTIWTGETFEWNPAYLSQNATQSSGSGGGTSGGGGSSNPTTGGGSVPTQTGGLLSGGYTFNANSSGPQIDPVTRQVTSDELASTQLDKLLSKDSALRQRAETQGKQYSNSRGLLNSSMGAEAAFGSWVDRAAPIAMDDAGKFTNVEDKNMDARNTFGLADKEFGFDLQLQGNELGWKSGENRLDRDLTRSENAATRGHESGMQSAEFAFQGGQNAADREQRLTEIGLNQAFQSEEAAMDRQQRLDELSQTQGFEATQNQIVRDFQAAQNEIERTFQGEENAADRLAREDELARQAATELMRQVSGMNASLTDAIAQIQAADIDSTGKQKMVDNLIELHYNNLNTTTAMADFDVVNGEVVYRESETGSPQQQVPGSSVSAPDVGVYEHSQEYTDSVGRALVNGLV